MTVLSGAVRRSLLGAAGRQRVWRGFPSRTSNNRSYSRSSFPQKEESADNPFSSYQYPNAKEAPQITRSQASQVLEEDHSAPSLAKTKATQENRFDREGLSTFEVDAIRNQQRSMLHKSLSPSVMPATVIPEGTTSKLSSASLSTPSTELTKLDNGIRVVSVESSSSSLASTIGLVHSVGSRYEIHPQQRGVTNLLELLSFEAPTPKYPEPASFLALNLGGAAHFCSTGKEQSLQVVDLLRPHVDEAFSLIQQVLLEPQLMEEHIEGAKEALRFQAEVAPPEVMLGEALQLAAFGNGQQLGQPHCYLEENPQLTAAVVSEFWQSQFVDNPEEIVVAGVGIGHDQLVGLTEQHFGHLKQVSDKVHSAKMVKSVYQGGRVCLERETEDEFVRLALGLKVDGWHSEDLVTLCVLQTLLGGGSSFSAGGPGKGMYSRLYREVLNRYRWAEAAEAYVSFFDEVGVFGLTGSTDPKNARDMLQVFADHLKRLAETPVTEEELDRARKMLRGHVLTQLESRLVLFEDLGRQILTYGHREGIQTTCQRIESVTAADIQGAVQRALAAGPPTVVAVGPKANEIPSHEEVVGWF